MPDPVKPVLFVSHATIYKSGAGHPFPPGSSVPLHPDDAEAFRKSKLEKLAEPEKKAEPLAAAAIQPAETPEVVEDQKQDNGKTPVKKN